MKSKISIIVATGRNREIGKKNGLLWKIPEELKRFREITTGHPIIMGRKTYESIGRPLPNRTNIVITRDENFKVEGVIVVNSLERAIEKAEESLDLGSSVSGMTNKVDDNNETFVIGGAQIYEQALPIADKLYLTIVDADFPEADAYLSDYSDFSKVVSEKDLEVEGTRDNTPQTYKIKFLELEK